MQIFVSRLRRTILLPTMILTACLCGQAAGLQGCEYGSDERTVLLLHLNESGNFLSDSSGVHNDGASFGATSVTGFVGLGRSFVQHTYVRVPNSLSLQIADTFTVEAWINPSAVQFSPGLLPVIVSDFGVVPPVGGYQLSLLDDGRLRAGVRGSGQALDLTGSALPTPNKWYHVAMTYQQSGTDAVVSLYRDGQLDAQSTFANFQIEYSDAAQPYLYVGESYDGIFAGGDRWFPGIVDEIRISNVVRQPGELGCAARVDTGTLWIGLKNSDDQGTQFDLRAELYKNGALITSGEARCITGVTRNPNLAKEAMVPFGPITDDTVNPGDTFSFRVLTRIGTTPEGAKCSGPGGSHSNAAGLRLYYDSASRPSRFGDANAALFLHSSGQDLYFDGTAPTAETAKSKDSPSVNFAGGNAWKEVGTWSTSALN